MSNRVCCGGRAKCTKRQGHVFEPFNRRRRSTPMYLQLLYAVMARRQTPLEGDLYEGIDPLEGWPEDDPDHKQDMRDAIKRNVSAMLFLRDAQRSKKLSLVKRTKAALSKGVTRAVLEDRVKARHPDIAAWFGVPGIGFELMLHESAIMINTMLRCLTEDAVVLPLHDGLLVAEPHKEVAKKAMQEAFGEYTGGVRRESELRVTAAPF